MTKNVQRVSSLMAPTGDTHQPSPAGRWPGQNRFKESLLNVIIIMIVFTVIVAILTLEIIYESQSVASKRNNARTDLVKMILSIKLWARIRRDGGALD